MKLLICTDGSEHSEYAMSFAGRVFGKGGDVEAVVLFVSPAAGSIYDHYMIVEEDFSKKVIEISSHVLRRAGDLLGKYGIKAEVKARKGHAAEQIMKELDSDSYDMVVVGSHGMTGLTNFVLGSVSTKVVLSSKIPVLVVKKPGE